MNKSLLKQFFNKVLRFLFKRTNARPLVTHRNRIGGENIRLMQIGGTKWFSGDFKDKLQEFTELYKNRPIKDNTFGMKAPHMFLAWFIMQSLRPKCIIESGTYKGQGTWFFEKAVPSAVIHSIDINLSQREYISSHVIYYGKDFSFILLSFGRTRIIIELLKQWGF